MASNWNHSIFRLKKTDIRGFLLILKLRKGLLLTLVFLIFVILVIVTVFLCNGAVQLYLEKSTIVKRKIRYEPVDFPAVTFCTGYQSEFSQIQNNASKTKLKLTSVSKSVDFYSTESLSERRTTASTKKYNRQKRKADYNGACPDNYFHLATGCYLKTNFTANWSTAQNFCRTNDGASLPIFHNFLTYITFFKSHRSSNQNTELWLGLYTNGSSSWTWTTGCAYNIFYPSFWNGKEAQQNYGSKIQYARLTSTGVLTNNGSLTLPVLCYKPLWGKIESCGVTDYSKKSSSQILCNNFLTGTKNRWCQTNVLNNSNEDCFCIYYNSQKRELGLDEAVLGCRSVNGTVVDPNSLDERSPLIQLINNLDKNDSVLMNMCPFNTTYVNRSCLMFLPRPAHSFNEAENLCQKAYPGSHLMSLHSEMEHQAAYYELYTKSHPWNAHGFGVYIGMFRNNKNATWQWNDGTKMDYFPGWSIWGVPDRPRNNTHVFMIPLDGLVHDYSEFFTYSMCRINLSLTKELKSVMFTPATVFPKNESEDRAGALCHLGIKIRIDPLPVNRSHKIVVKSPRQDVLLNSTENGTLTHKKILESRIYRKPFMPNVLLSNVNNDLLLYAAYHGSKLKEREFSKFYHSSIGNCYTFNGKSPVKKATRTGISGGLKLELTFNSSNISTPGLLLMLTSPTETISPNSSSYKISTAFQTDVALSAIENTLLTYGRIKCLKDPPLGYSFESCYNKCLQSMIEENCGCADPTLHFFHNAAYCSSKTSKCITDTKLAVSKRRYHKCLCRQPCKTISYRKVLSLSRLIAKHNRGIPINQRAVVNVYFISLNVDSYEAHLSYTFSMMVTNIAQIITLFLGFSIMSLIEICQWFLHFVWH